MVTKVGPDTDIKWELILFDDTSSIVIPIQDVPPSDIHELASDISKVANKRVTVRSTTVTQTTYGDLCDT